MSNLSCLCSSLPRKRENICDLLPHALVQSEWPLKFKACPRSVPLYANHRCLLEEPSVLTMGHHSQKQAVARDVSVSNKSIPGVTELGDGKKGRGIVKEWGGGCGESIKLAHYFKHKAVTLCMDFGLTHGQELLGKGKTSDYTKIGNIKVLIVVAVFILIGYSPL